MNYGGRFVAQLEDCRRILDGVNLLYLYDNSIKKIHGAAARFKGKSYESIWRELYRNYEFTFALVDYSLILFDVTDQNRISFSYYENPYVFIDKNIFLAEFGAESEQWYEQYLSEYKKESITPVRYDFYPNDYTPGRHPVAHMHIGYANNIRIGCSYVLTPQLFLSFILRQCYPDQWQALQANGGWLNERMAFQKIERNHFSEADTREFYLHFLTEREFA